MKLLTPFKLTEKPTLSMSQKDEIILLGSCFSENMQEKFLQAGFRCQTNPFGVIYNPLSLALLLDMVSSKRELPANSIVHHTPEVSSLLTHSTFRAASIEKLKKEFANVIKTLNDGAKTYVLSFGTAWIYHHKETGYSVANCHKIDPDKFNKRLLPQNEVFESLTLIYTSLKAINNNNKILFTLSPVRHLKDGFIENQTSKSTLYMAIQKCVQELDVHYFPAYEIMMDELRDYRFYAEDLIHPNTAAIKHIWSYFSLFYFTDETRQLATRVEAYYKLKNHRVLSHHPELIQAHKDKVLRLRKELEKEYHQLSLP